MEQMVSGIEYVNKMNDSSVSSIGINNLKSSQPYILYYIKQVKVDIYEEIPSMRKRKDSTYEEGDLHCKRKESRSYSIDIEPNTKNTRRMSIDSRESLSKIANHKSGVSDKSNDIDAIFSNAKVPRVIITNVRKNSKEEQPLQQNIDLPTLVNKPEAMNHFEMNHRPVTVSLPPAMDDDGETVTLLPVVISNATDLTPRLSCFSKQLRFKRIRQKSVPPQTMVPEALLEKRNYNESPSPSPSINSNLADLIEDYDDTFGTVVKQKDLYDVDYDKGKMRKNRTKKAKVVLNFQKIADSKNINH